MALTAAVASAPAPNQRTPVAHPPAKGRSATDEARRVREELVGAQARCDQADISQVDGAAVSTANDVAMALALELLSIEGPLRPDEVGSPWPELTRLAVAIAGGDYADRLHLGWSG